MAEQKRVRRTPEQIAADIDGQISKLEENIRGLEEKILCNSQKPL